MQRLMAVVLLLVATRLSGQPCAPSPTRLCLNGGRFAVEVSWKDFQGNTGQGQAVALTSDTGYFWFFNDTNVELVVKVLDARALNGHFWVFYGALSNVQYTLTVTDTATGTVRTYTNPSGTFGSVGDTNAFPASTVTVAAWRSGQSDEMPTLGGLLKIPTALPEAARAAAPCPVEPTSLFLSGCRFRVSVSWKDFQGNTGQGQAVSLTADTGYFWFFNAANVELVVKVLDARTLNGRFWVFYGALSNVEYTLRVEDTVSGAFKEYANPSGRFGSAGDTEAFRSGRAVSVTPDSSRTASAEISANNGGSLTATAADGTLFTLQVPRHALLTDLTVTMTPVASVAGLPLSGGFAAGVQLEPEGLRLMDAATLMIRPATPVPPAEEIPIAWRGSGEELQLALPDPKKGDLKLFLFHFSGAGIGRGTSADLSSQASSPLANAVDVSSQKMADQLTRERRAQLLGQEGDPNFGQHLIDLLRDFFESSLRPRLPLMASDCDVAEREMSTAVQWARQVELLGLGGELASEVNAVSQTLRASIQNCYEEAYDKCKSNNDPQQSHRMLQYLRQAELLGIGGLDENKIAACLTFELQFENLVTTLGLDGSGYRHRLRATVPVALGPVFSGMYLSGQDKLDYTSVEQIGPPTGPPLFCTFTGTTTSSTFDVPKMLIDFNLYEGGKPPADPVILFYDVGRPFFGGVDNCPGPPPIPPFTIDVPAPNYGWLSPYGHFLHPSEQLSETFFITRHWDFVGRSLWARKTYEQTVAPGPGSTIDEKTTFDLFHRPK